MLLLQAAGLLTPIPDGPKSVCGLGLYVSDFCVYVGMQFSGMQLRSAGDSRLP